MAEEHATAFAKRSIKTSAKLAGLKLAVSMMDLTTLEGKIRRAKSHSFAARRCNRSTCAMRFRPARRFAFIPTSSVSRKSFKLFLQVAAWLSLFSLGGYKALVTEKYKTR